MTQQRHADGRQHEPRRRPRGASRASGRTADRPRAARDVARIDRDRLGIDAGHDRHRETGDRQRDARHRRRRRRRAAPAARSPSVQPRCSDAASSASSQRRRRPARSARHAAAAPAARRRAPRAGGARARAPGVARRASSAPSCGRPRARAGSAAASPPGCRCRSASRAARVGSRSPRRPASSALQQARRLVVVVGLPRDRQRAVEALARDQREREVDQRDLLEARMQQLRPARADRSRPGRPGCRRCRP